MPTNKIFVSIIIPVYQNPGGLPLCLEALNKQTYPPNKFEIIIVNNDSLNKLFLDHSKYNIRILTEEKPGSYAARNKGIIASRGNLLGFCDSDCIPSPNWIENAVHFFNENKNYHRLAGKIELFWNNQYPQNYAQLHEKIFAFKQEGYAKNGTAATANMFAYRHVFDDVGLFDENLLSGGDLLWGRKATSAGYSIGFSKKVLVFHPPRKSLRELIQKTKRIVSGYIILNDAFYRKNPVNAIYHGLSMLKPPIKAASIIFTRKDISRYDQLMVYFLEYLLKLIQLREFISLQLGGSPKR